MEPDAIRREFNNARVWDRVSAGELAMRVRLSRAAPPEERSGQPAGTLSQYIDIYASDGSYLASAHRYLRPRDDPITGGRPDPKRMVVGRRMLAVHAPLPAAESETGSEAC